MFIAVCIGAGLLFLGIATGTLGAILQGIFSLLVSALGFIATAIGTFLGNLLVALFSGIWHVIASAGAAIGSFLGNLFVGLFTGIWSILQVIALPALILGLIVLVVFMVWKAYFT